MSQPAPEAPKQEEKKAEEPKKEEKTEEPKKEVKPTSKWTTNAWTFKKPAAADASKADASKAAQDDAVDDSHKEAPSAAAEQPNVDQDEEELFADKVLLYRLDSESKEWKERGSGVMKVLKNIKTGQCRCLMRRNQTFRVCCNHFILPHMELKESKGTDRAFMWAATDYADGPDGSKDVLTIKLKSAEVAQQFKKAFDDARKFNAEILKKQEKKE